MRQPDRTERRGYTLAELLVAMLSASALLVGLSSSIYVASQATQTSNTPTTAAVDGNQAVTDLLSDLEFAQSFSERAAGAITFTVPDRDGDANPETIRYAWSGTPGDPLTRQYNGGPVASVVDNVYSFQHDIPLAGGNLLSNGDMEDGTVGWIAFPDSTMTTTNTSYTGGQGMYSHRWASSGESGVKQDVTVSLSNGTIYEVEEWLQTYDTGSITAKIQLRVTSSGSGEQVFATSGTSITTSDWTYVNGTVTPTWSGSLMSAYWEAISDASEVHFDDAVLRVKQNVRQNVNISLQVGGDSRALIHAGVGLQNAPL